MSDNADAVFLRGLAALIVDDLPIAPFKPAVGDRLLEIADKVEPANTPIAEATVQQGGNTFRIAVYGCDAATDGTQERALLESIVDWASECEGERCSRLADDAYADMMAERGGDE